MSNQIVNTPMYDSLMQFKRTIMSELRVSLPGTISGVGTDGTVDVTVGVMQNVAQQGSASGMDFLYPKLLACPVFTVQGGGVGAVMPIEIGDECLVVFSDRCINNWLLTGQATPLPDLRMHDINDGYVLVGLNSGGNVLETPLDDFEGGICETANLNGAAVVVNSATSLISVRNGTQNLKLTVLDSLLDALTLLNLGIIADAGVIPNAAAAATAANITIALIKANLAQLLY